MMAGPPRAMAQEHACIAARTQARKSSVTADSLTLTDDQGTVLVRYAAKQRGRLTSSCRRACTESPSLVKTDLARR
jgi:predicted lipoprotein with Yx(FWY)xxD motif